MWPRWCMDDGFHLLSVQTKECIALSAKRKYGNLTTFGAMERGETNFDLTTVPTVARRWIEATTVRLIDADALIEEAYVEGAYGYVDAKQIADAPTVDAVEVVRCKDCIRRYDTDECPMCFLSEGQYYEFTRNDGFCDRGEREDNG